MAKTKYVGVYTDEKGQFYYQTELGVDKLTGKRIRKKGRFNQNGQRFKSALEAYKELTRIKNEYHQTKGYNNYNITYDQYLDEIYLPYYETTVQESTFIARENVFNIIRDRFQGSEMREIDVRDVHFFRTWLLSKKGADYSQSYASLVFGTFRRTLDYAVTMEYLEYNVSMKVDAIPKGKFNPTYWTKQEFKKVISKVYIEDFYEHMCFVMLWIYFMTGVRVNEGTALKWNDVNFSKKRLRVYGNLHLQSKSKWEIKDYTKTDDGRRIIALDDDTIQVLKVWKKRQQDMAKMDFIVSYDGLPMTKSTISRIMNRYAKLAGVHPIPAKGLRHSHASYLINEFNVSVLILSKRMGHSSPEITLRHYSHMWSGMDETIAEEMTGNISIKTADMKQFDFIGNQNFDYDNDGKNIIPTNSPTKVLKK